MPDSFNVTWCRAQFPALRRTVNGHPAIYFDGPAGSQIPTRVADAMRDYLLNTNANHAGVFATSRESDAILHAAHEGLANFVGTDDPRTIIFGPNMTSLTFALSRAMAQTWQPGDEIIVTRLDHDANVTPWVLAARDAGVTVRYVGVRPEDCTLDMDDFADQLSPRTRLVAVTCASNATGTINPVSEIAALAHAAGALVFLDAVHYAPHALLDVNSWNCDFLACSAYKFFGPHEGVLWARRELLETLPAYKLRPAPDDLPGRWMTGTQSHEAIAGTLAAVDYVADLGHERSPDAANRRAALREAFHAIRTYEQKLVARLLAGLSDIPGVRIWGIVDPTRLAERVPTVAITHEKLSPVEMATQLAADGIFVWHGNFYALPLTETLDLEPEGLLRIGLLHYNTQAEIDRLLNCLGKIITNAKA